MAETKTSRVFCGCGVRLAISTRGSGDMEVYCPICGASHGTVQGNGKDVIVYVRGGVSPPSDKKEADE